MTSECFSGVNTSVVCTGTTHPSSRKIVLSCYKGSLFCHHLNDHGEAAINMQLSPAIPPRRPFMHDREMLGLGFGSEPRLSAISGLIGPGLCGIVDMDFREYSFHALG
jgi:hypothetical protein